MRRLNKIIYLIIFSIIVLPFSVKAAGSVSVSTRNINLAPNGSTSFSITASNSVGKVTVSSSNTSVARVSVDNLWVENNTQTVSVTAGSVGTATITVNLADVATFDEEKLTGSYTITVTVAAPAPPPTPTPTPTPTPGGGTNPKTNNKSGNNNLKKFEVENYKINSTGATSYALTVKNSVEKIKIIATPSDSKATVTGAGEKTLRVGDNEFKIVVTAENGSKKAYTLVVTRKDDTFYLDDLDDAISASKESIVITLKENDILTSEQLQKIKKSNKNAYFIKKKDSKTLYSWMINSKNITNQGSIKMDLYFTASNKSKLEKLTDYREGIYLNFSHSGVIPKDTVLRIYVADKYADGDSLHLYYLDGESNEISFINQEVKVVNGYVEISIDHCSDYFLTKATISGENVKTVNTEENALPLLVMVVMLVLIICLMVGVFLKISSKQQEDNKEEEKTESLEADNTTQESTETVEQNTTSEVQSTETVEQVSTGEVQSTEIVETTVEETAPQETITSMYNTTEESTVNTQ